MARRPLAQDVEVFFGMLSLLGNPDALEAQLRDLRDASLDAEEKQRLLAEQTSAHITARAEAAAVLEETNKIIAQFKDLHTQVQREQALLSDDMAEWKLSKSNYDEMTLKKDLDLSARETEVTQRQLAVEHREDSCDAREEALATAEDNLAARLKSLKALAG